MKKTLLTTLLAMTIIGIATAQTQTDSLTINDQVNENTAKIDKLQFDFGKFGALKISGYIQGQWQLAESAGAAAFGDGGSFGADMNNRFMLRRGRIKFTYTKGIASVVFQPDFTEKGVSIKDAYLAINSKNKAIGGQFGIFDRPFGYEISYSSSLRESPERSRVFLSLFPGERDLGAMLTLKGAKGWLSQFTLNAGLFNGNGVGAETDSHKDFIGRLAWLKKTNNAQVGLAFSYYNGGVRNPVGENYKFTSGEGFKAQTVETGKFSRREYFGVAAQYLQSWIGGTTNIRAEYLWGSQPGTLKNNNDPSGSSFGVGTVPLYLRQFMGGYVILVQDIAQSKHSIVLKYDYYDPNTKVKGDQIGELTGTGAADVAYSTFGVGYLFRWNEHLRLMAYYDFVENEKSANLEGYADRIKQNVLTLRVQVKF